MNILFGTSPVVRIHGPGGLINQILQTKTFLEQNGHSVALFNPWEPFDPEAHDVFHLFFATQATYDLGRRVKQAGLKLVVSPIIDKAIPELAIRASNALMARLPKVYTDLSLASALCRLADAVVVPSTDGHRKVTRAFGIGFSKVVIVPNGVNIKYYYADPSLFIEKYGKKDFVLSVGVIGNQRKNHYRLIRVLGRLQLDAVFIGPIWDNEYARRCLEAAGRYSHIKILGVLEEAELMSAYAAADTLVLPSLVEGTGLVALEAGLAGTKVVITRIGGPPYYFGDLVEYVDPRSEKSIRDHLLRAIRRPKDSRLREHIRANFTWDRVLPKLVQVYEDLIP